MSWSNVPLELRVLAEDALSDKQLVALRLWANGAGYRRIGLILGISQSTARGRVTRSLDTLQRLLDQEEYGHITDPSRRTPDPLTTPTAGSHTT